MKKLILIFIFCCIFIKNIKGRLLISEIAPAVSKSDWVEIYYKSSQRESINISNLYVTMYYGTNEKLSNDNITLYSYDRATTPYDDRYAVIHLTDPLTKDETDLTGDTNHNGIIDIYCNNYKSSLWNSDCVVAIDTNDSPDDGMLDCIFYSNQDDTINTTIAGYMEDASLAGEWIIFTAKPLQKSMFDISAQGLSAHQSISRLLISDSNSYKDFAVTNFQTPGYPNIIKTISPGNKSIFKLKKKTIIFNPNKNISPNALLTINTPCTISIKIFTSDGLLLYKSPLYSKFPGPSSIAWKTNKRKKIRTGLYIALLEARDNKTGYCQSKKFIFIVNRYK